MWQNTARSLTLLQPCHYEAIWNNNYPEFNHIQIHFCCFFFAMKYVIIQYLLLGFFGWFILGICSWHFPDSHALLVDVVVDVFAHICIPVLLWSELQGETKILKLKNLRPQDYANYSCIASVRNVCGIPDRNVVFRLTNKTGGTTWFPYWA